MTLAPVPSTTAITPFALISHIMVKMYTGSRGMIAFSMVSFTIAPNSSNPFFKAPESVKMMPTPIMNDRTSAVMMSQIGGILRSKYGRNSFAEMASAESSPACRKFGKALEAHRCAKNPEQMVER